MRGCCCESIKLEKKHVNGYSLIMSASKFISSEAIDDNNNLISEEEDDDDDEEIQEAFESENDSEMEIDVFGRQPSPEIAPSISKHLPKSTFFLFLFLFLLLKTK